MFYTNDPYDFDSSSDAELIGYASPPSSPIASPVARSPLVAKSRKSPQNKNIRRNGPRVSYIPAPSHMSAKDILEKHPNLLYHNNILKVALHYTNAQIDDKLVQLGYTKRIAYARILSATRRIEKHFNITSGAFLTAFNRESSLNGIHRPFHIYPRDQVLLSHHAAKINEAMAWIKKGGPRPPTASPSPKARSVALPVPSDDNKENEVEITAASIFDEKLQKAQMPKTFVCPHIYCSCSFTTAKDNHRHIREVHYQAAEALVQRANDGQIAGPDGWVDLP